MFLQNKNAFDIRSKKRIKGIFIYSMQGCLKHTNQFSFIKY